MLGGIPLECLFLLAHGGGVLGESLPLFPDREPSASRSRPRRQQAGAGVPAGTWDCHLVLICGTGPSPIKAGRASKHQGGCSHPGWRRSRARSSLAAMPPKPCPPADQAPHAQPAKGYWGWAGLAVQGREGVLGGWEYEGRKGALWQVLKPRRKGKMTHNVTLR